MGFQCRVGLSPFIGDRAGGFEIISCILSQTAKPTLQPEVLKSNAETSSTTNTSVLLLNLPKLHPKPQSTSAKAINP